jgi:hypothetical protein
MEDSSMIKAKRVRTDKGAARTTRAAAASIGKAEASIALLRPEDGVAGYLPVLAAVRLLLVEGVPFAQERSWDRWEASDQLADLCYAARRLLVSFEEAERMARVPEFHAAAEAALAKVNPWEVACEPDLHWEQLDLRQELLSGVRL